jgi:hypothetical protein
MRHAFDEAGTTGDSKYSQRMMTPDEGVWQNAMST